MDKGDREMDCRGRKRCKYLGFTRKIAFVDPEAESAMTIGIIHWTGARALAAKDCHNRAVSNQSGKIPACGTTLTMATASDAMNSGTERTLK